jgi:hypothetical protein
MRIGLHLMSNRNTAKTRDYIARVQPEVVKTIAPDRAQLEMIREVSPETRIIARDVWNPQTIGAYGDFQNRVLGKAREFGDLIDYWEGYNEVGFRGDEMSDFARKERGLAQRLNDLGRGAAIGGFSTGAVPLEDWERFLPALEYAHEQGKDRCIYHFHEYSAPFMQALCGNNQWNWDSGGYFTIDDPCTAPGVEGWTTLRYRKARRLLVRAGLDNVHMAITEGGLDDIQPRGGPVQAKGWKDYRNTEWARTVHGSYADQLRWYSERLTEDPYILGAVDFGFATIDPQWNSFDLVTDDADQEREKLIGLLLTLPRGHRVPDGNTLPPVIDPGQPTQPAPVEPVPGEVPIVIGDGPTDWPPRLTEAHEARVVASPGEGWAAFAARVRGYDPAAVPFAIRQQWAENIRRANGLGPESGIEASRAYRSPWHAAVLRTL